MPLDHINGTGTNVAPIPTSFFAMNTATLSSNSSSLDVLQPYQLWVVVMLTVVIAIGVPGNLLVGAVYLSKQNKTSAHLLILVMALLDLVISLFSVVRMVHWVHESTYRTGYKCQLFRVLSLWSEFYSAYMTTAIAVDRYFQICHPHYHVTVRKALVGSLVGLAASNLSSFTVAFLYGVENRKCQIVKDGLALYIPLGLAFSALITLMVTALVLYLLVYLGVRKRFHNRRNFGSVIFVQPSGNNAGESGAGASRSSDAAFLAAIGTDKTATVEKARESEARRGEYHWTTGRSVGGGNCPTSAQNTSIKASATYLEIRIKRSPDGSEEVEVERAELAIEKTTVSEPGSSEAEPSHQSSASDEHTGPPTVHRQYKDLMVAILEPQGGHNLSRGPSLDTPIEDLAAATRARRRSSSALLSLKPGNSVEPLDRRRSIAAGDRRGSIAPTPGDRRGSMATWAERSSRTGGPGPASPSIGRTARMLLLATLVFVGTWTARCLMWLITNSESDRWTSLRIENPYAYATLTVVQHIYYTTPAFNPIIYSFANPRFRSDRVRLLKIVRGWRRKVFPA